jgi:TP901 family phage tail tape measure protein
MAEGTITRKEIITDEALKWGDEYAKTLNEAIAKNREFVDSIILLNAENVKLRRSENQTEFIKQKNEVKLISERSIATLKEEQLAETALEKIKQEAIRTQKLALELEAKKQTASRASTKLTIEERVANEVSNRVAKEQAILSSKMTSAYTKLNLQRTIAKKTLLDLLSAENQNTAAIKKAEIEFGKLDTRVRKADQAVGDFHKSVGNYPKISSLTSGLKNLAGAFGLIGGVALFASIMKNAFDTIKLFDQGIADLSAITGAAGKDLDYLKNQAIALGKGTQGGAVAVVEAYKLIASAKPELLENVSALNQVTEAVLTLAQASGMEMPAAALALTDAMNQFGADASQASVFVDALANGAKYGSAEIPQVTEALLKFGAVARTSNVSIQESTALVELLAENGLKGADAGTALRNVLLKISAPDALPMKAQQEFAKLGISLETLKDKSIPVQEKLELLKPLLKDNASIVKVFGLENATAALNVLGHTDRLKELTSKMNENGTALEQANIRMNTLNGSLDLLESAWGSFVLSLSEKGNGAGGLLKWIIDDLALTLEKTNNLFTSSEKLRERELAKIRKEGADNAIKNYSDKNKRSIEDLNNVIKWNDAEIADNTRAALALEKINKEKQKTLGKGVQTSGFNPKTLNKTQKEILANQEKIGALNNRTVFAQGENTTVKGFIQSRTAKPVVPDPNAITGNTSKVDADDAEKAAKEALEKAKKLSDSLYELQKQRLERSIKINGEIAADDKMSDEVRIKALEFLQSKEIDLAKINEKHSLDADKFVLAKDRMNANQKLVIVNESENKIIDIKKKKSEEILKINQFDDAKYQKDLENKMSIITVSMNAEMQAENERFAALGDLESMAQAEREKAIEEHEQRLFDIKKAFAIKTLKLQIVNLQNELDASDLLPVNEQISADKRQKIAEVLSKAKLDLSDVESSLNGKKNEKDVMNEKEKAMMILDISAQLTGGLSDLANAFTEAKIQKIDDEINKNNEYYDKQIELAGNDIRQKELLEKERDQKNAELEKKKKAAQHKQAVYDKAAALAQAAIMTALAILNALNSKPFLPMGPIMATLAGVMGAVQIGTILATPIPKYKMGRKGGPAETAWVGDGGVPEVITGPNGLNPRLTPNIPTLTSLGKGDIVHKSVEDYNSYIRASILSGLNQDHRRMNDFHNNQNNDLYGKESLLVMKETLLVLKRQKRPSQGIDQKIDINHHLWKMGNTNWKN